MMKKRWQVLLSIVLVMVFSVSFSVPVFAYTDTWILARDSFSGSYTFTPSSATYFSVLDSEQFLKGQAGTFSYHGSHSSSSSSGSGSFNAPFSSSNVEIRYYYIQIMPLTWTSGTPCRARIVNLSISDGDVSGSSAVYGKGVYMIGSYSQVIQDQAVAVPSVPAGNYYYDNSADDYIYLWYRLRVRVVDSSVSFSVPLYYGFDRIEVNYYGTDLSINQSIDSLGTGVVDAIHQQTDTVTNGYDNSGMNSSNDKLSSSLTEYDNTESQVMDQSVQYIDAVTFFDPTMHLQLMSCITYTSTFLQNLFVALGDWSVLVLIALSLAFALMLIGWFKYRS